MQILQPPGWPRPRGYSNGVMALLQVSALLEDRAKVEIETTAVIPD